jgi:hypothetical protein
MPSLRKPLPQARGRATPEREFSLRLAGLALFLSVAVCALLVDRAGVLGGIQRMGDILEAGIHLIGSVDMPFG